MLKRILTDPRKSFLALGLVKLLLLSGSCARIFPDSSSYYSLNVFDLSQWPNATRTPGYPAIFSIASLLPGGDSLDFQIHFAIALQFLISWVAAWVFGKIVHQFTGSDKLRLVAMWVYGTSYVIFSWETFVLTESLALSGVVFYIGLLAAFLKAPKARYAVAIFALLLLLTFIRPTFLMYFPITLVFFFCYAVLHKKWKALFQACACCLVFFLPLHFYMSAYEEKFGVYTTSRLLARQTAVIIAHTGMLEDPAPSQKELADIMKEGLTYDPNRDESDISYARAAEAKLEQVADLPRINEFNREMILHDPLGFLFGRVVAALDALKLPYSYPPEPNFSLAGTPGVLLTAIAMVPSYLINFSCVVCFGIGAFIYFMFKWIRKKEFDLVWAGIWCCILVPCATAIFATYAEFPRTSLAALPFFFLGVFLALQKIVSWIRAGHLVTV